MSENQDELVYNGYFTFNDVDDEAIRAYNRGNTILNIVEDLTAKKWSKESIFFEVVNYLSLIPQQERYNAYVEFNRAASTRPSLKQ